MSTTAETKVVQEEPVASKDDTATAAPAASHDPSPAKSTEAGQDTDENKNQEQQQLLPESSLLDLLAPADRG